MRKISVILTTFVLAIACMEHPQVARAEDLVPFRALQFNDPQAVAFSPNGKLVVCGGPDSQEQGTLMVWDVRSGNLKCRLKTQTDKVGTIVFSPDEKLLAMISGEDQYIRLYDTDAWEFRRTLNTPANTNHLAIDFSPDGQSIASVCGNKEVLIFDVRTGNIKKTLTGHSEIVACIAYSSDGKSLASGGQREVRIWDPQSGELKKAISLPESRNTLILSLCFSPDGKTLAGGCGDSKIRIWDVQSGRHLRDLEVEGKHNAVFCVRFSPDGKVLASRSGVGFSGKEDRWTIRLALVAGSPVHLWDVRTGELLTDDFARDICPFIHAHPMAFSPDGKILATARNTTSRNPSIKLWDVKELIRIHSAKKR